MKAIVLNKRIFTLLLSSIACLSVAYPQGINFEQLGIEKAMEKSVSENKLLFIDCYTTWCGPCRLMSRDVFPNDTVGAFFNENFVNIKVDMDSQEGVELGKKYNVTGYPTLLFVDPRNGEVVNKLIGGNSDIQWLIAGAEKALDPARNIPGLMEVYLRDRKNRDALTKLLDNLIVCQMDDEKEEILSTFLNELPEEEKCDLDIWRIIEKYVTDVYSDSYSFLKNNAACYERIVGEKTIDDKINNLTKNAIQQFLYRKRVPHEHFNINKFKALHAIIHNQTNSKNNFYKAQYAMIKEAQNGEYDAMLDAMEDALQLELVEKSDQLFFIWLNLTYLFECDEKPIIDRGLAWAEHIKPEENMRMRSYWLGMKARLYAAKGDFHTEQALRNEAANIQQSLNDIK